MSDLALVVEGLGVRLSRLAHADIHLVRSWRNDPEIAQYMHYREHISHEQQERWFASLDPARDYYFIVEFEGQKIGLSTLKNVDFAQGSAEGGLFLVPKLLRNSLISYRASLPGLDWIYRELGLRTVTARMRRENKRALRFNASIGHVVNESLSNAESVVTVQTRERWEAVRPEFVRIFGEWYGPDAVHGE